MKTSRERTMTGKVCLVTGSSSGIGKEAAVELAAAGATVVMVARDRARGEAAMAEVKSRGSSEDVSLMLADLSSQRSIRQLASEFAATHSRLDVLLNNAGAIVGERRLTEDGFETTFALNHLGYFLLTSLLLPLLEASAPSRIVNVASDAHKMGTINFDDLHGERQFSAWSAYGQSKLANILFTTELARRLAGTGVTANCLHPGVVRTHFGDSGNGLTRIGLRLIRPFLISASKGAETLVYLASSPEVEGVSGKYFVKKREAPTTPEARDESIAKRLWEVSETLTGGAFGAKAAGA